MGKEVFLLAQPAAGNKASTEKGNTTHCSHVSEIAYGIDGLVPRSTAIVSSAAGAWFAELH